MTTTIRVGVSSCLLGEKVRYDGGHQLSRYVRDTLGEHFELVPVCPEFELGLGVPRDPMRLEGDPAAPRLIVIATRVDLTERMNAWAAHRLAELAAAELCGFVFKSRSPSSGMVRVPVVSGGGEATGHSSGLFARAFMDRFPTTPVVEEIQLEDSEARERFVQRVLDFHRSRGLSAPC